MKVEVYERPVRPLVANISNREIEVLENISYGFTTSEIAQRLYLSSHTVVSHRKNLQSKLDARNIAVLVRKAFEYGLLQLG